MTSRLPFSTGQLQAILGVSLYTGRRDDGNGYATPGPERPKNARFGCPLSMIGGLRLNEACQLDVANIKRIDDVACFVITKRSKDDHTDKRLKTSAQVRRAAKCAASLKTYHFGTALISALAIY